MAQSTTVSRKTQALEIEVLARENILLNIASGEAQAPDSDDSDDDDKGSENASAMQWRNRESAAPSLKSLKRTANPFNAKKFAAKEEKMNEDAQKEENKKMPIQAKHAWRLLKKEWKLLLISTIISLAASAISTISPSYLGDYYDAMNCVSVGNQQNIPQSQWHIVLPTLCAEGTTHESVQEYFLIMVALAVSSLVGAQLASFFFSIAGRRIIARTRCELLASFVLQDAVFFDRRGVGELLSRLSADTAQFQGLFLLVNDVLSSLGMLGAGLYFMLTISEGLTIIVCGSVPFMAGASLVVGRMIRIWTQRIMKLLAQQSQIAQEILTSMYTLRVFELEPEAAQRYAGAVGSVYRQAIRIVWVSSSYSVFNAALTSSASLLTVYLGGRMILGSLNSPPFSDALKLGQLFSFTLYAQQLRTAVSKLSGVYTNVVKCMTVSGILYSLLERQSEITTEAGTERKRLIRIEGGFTFDRVSFRYPLRPTQGALNGISIRLQPRGVNCIVGRSGCGKSTMLTLILALRQPDEGRILLDDVPLTEVDTRWFRRAIAYVSQEPVLFSCSIRENIRYGRRDATDDEIQVAAEQAAVSEFIATLPEGFETIIKTGHATQLSGGQKQRIAVARAFVRAAPILLLDEPTSALDVRSEELVTQALQRLSAGRTTIMATHKVPAMRAADFVVVLEKGKIVESGDPSTLIAQGGMFAQMVAER